MKVEEIQVPELRALVARTEGSIFFDTETQGKYGPLVCAQFYSNEWGVVYYMMINKILDVLEMTTIVKSAKHIVMQNAAYDLSCIGNELGHPFYVEFDKFDDTLPLARHEFPTEKSYKLGVLITLSLGYNPYEENSIVKEQTAVSFVRGRPLTEEQKIYGALDVFYLSTVWDRVCKHKDKQQYKLIKKVLILSMQFQRNGIPVNTEKAQQEIDMYLKKHNDLNLRNELGEELNVKSIPQIRKFLGGIEKSDKLALETAFLSGNEDAGKVRQAVKCRTRIPVLKKYIAIGNKKDQRIRGYFSPATRSGRMSCSEENLHAVSRDSRHLFETENKDTVLLLSDFAQLELRCITAVCADEKLEDIFRNGGDPHGVAAASIFKTKEYTKEQRYIAKTLNFSLLYGGGAELVRNKLITDAGMLISIEQAKALDYAWKEAWLGIGKYQQDAINAWRRGNLWSTPLGLPYKGNRITDMMNIKIQGFGAEVANLALHLIMRDTDHKNVKLCNYIHDGFLFECTNEKLHYNRQQEVVEQSFLKAWQEVCTHGKGIAIRDLPMPVSVMVAHNWGDLENGVNLL